MNRFARGFRRAGLAGFAVLQLGGCAIGNHAGPPPQGGINPAPARNPAATGDDQYTCHGQSHVLKANGRDIVVCDDLGSSSATGLGGAGAGSSVPIILTRAAIMDIVRRTAPACITGPGTTACDNAKDTALMQDCRRPYTANAVQAMLASGRAYACGLRYTLN